MAQTVQTPGVPAGSVKVGTADPPTTVVSCQVTVLEVAPEASYVNVPTTTGCEPRDALQGVKRNLRMTWLQDWGATDSLSEFMETNEGESVFIEFIPNGATTPKWVYEVTAIGGGEGGTMGDLAVADVTLPVVTRTPTMPA